MKLFTIITHDSDGFICELIEVYRQEDFLVEPPVFTFFLPQN